MMFTKQVVHGSETITEGRPQRDRRPSELARRVRAGRVRRIAAGCVLTAAVVAAAPGPAVAAGVFSVTGDSLTVRSGPGTNYGAVGTAHRGDRFTLECQYQNATNVNGNRTWDRVSFASGLRGVISDYWTSTPSFNSYAPNTGDCNAPPPPPPPPPTAVSAQMQRAANWAIAEKNSPDPTWSDHYGHAWSGWCEQFAEQAEGFTFRFASAIDHYRWQQGQGRIHTDANPPVGALVFYGGGGGYGHVAISIGGGQAVGTYGTSGQRLPVRQYPVTGYLSNPYYGWAKPIGS
jgi:hypothetical protein